jgi:hypothetical protein
MEHFCKYCNATVKNKQKHDSTEKHKKNKNKFDNIIRYKMEKINNYKDPTVAKKKYQPPNPN